MNLLLGCRAQAKARNDEDDDREGVIVNVDCQEKADRVWLLCDDGVVYLTKIARITILHHDVELIDKFNKNRIKRLKLMGEADPVSREELIDFDD